MQDDQGTSWNNKLNIVNAWRMQYNKFRNILYIRSVIPESCCVSTTLVSTFLFLFSFVSIILVNWFIFIFCVLTVYQRSSMIRCVAGGAVNHTRGTLMRLRIEWKMINLHLSVECNSSQHKPGFIGHKYVCSSHLKAKPLLLLKLKYIARCGRLLSRLSITKYNSVFNFVMAVTLSYFMGWI